MQLAIFTWFLLQSAALTTTIATQVNEVLIAPLFERTPPKWSSTYSVKGILMIPYAEIEEPFAAYADLKVGKSRVDYYGRTCRTFQRRDLGSYGASYKLIFFTTESVTNQINCFAVNGTESSPVEPQSILPDLSGFTYLGEEMKQGVACQKWQKEETIGNKVNKYTMWLQMVESNTDPSAVTAIPVHYEMKGYNNLLGSHYDHYFLTYKNFSAESPLPLIFDEFKSFTCHGFPGPGVEQVYTMNPIKEFVDGFTDHVDDTFNHFVRRHDKSYKNEQDFESRKDVYRQNMRYIHSQNRRSLTYALASNHLTDMTDSELQSRSMRGRLYSSEYNGGLPFAYTQADIASIPETLDWRIYGAVTPVKDQASCGSCWSFGTVGTLEGANFLQTGVLVRLSQQSLVDCSWGFGNNGCDGGEDFRAYKWVLKHNGIPTEDSYGGYLGQDGLCHLNDHSVKIGFQMESYVNVTSGDNDAMKVAIAKHGPLSVAIDASHKSFAFYSNGVYYEPDCDNSPQGLDHAVLAVGYGEIMGHKYWLIKNSWSTYWGNDGYVLMSQKDNNCGVATAATYVNPKK